MPLLDEPHYAQNLSMLSERAVFDTDILEEKALFFAETVLVAGTGGETSRILQNPTNHGGSTIFQKTGPLQSGGCGGLKTTNS